MTNASTEIFIGHAADPDMRHKASSGGIGTAVTRHLLESGAADTALTFEFNKAECRYEPRFVHSFADFNNCGSVYQEMDLLGFIKAHIDEIGKCAVVSCPPCQVGAIRAILQKAGKESFLISFLCSGQTLIEGTYAYYKMLGIDKTDVQHIQYRGNGWPSGIQITLKSGEKIFKPNYTEPWSTLHASHLFQPKRCFYCTLAYNDKADITLADPWLDEYKDDKIGNSFLLVHTRKGKDVVAAMQAEGLLRLKEETVEKFETAQRPNIEKAERVKREKSAIDAIVRLQNRKWYRNLATRNAAAMRRHIKVAGKITTLYRLMSKIKTQGIASLFKAHKPANTPTAGTPDGPKRWNG